MSNVFLFDTKTERDNFIMGPDYTIPHVSGLVDSEEITYNNRLVSFLNKLSTYHNDDELVAEECKKAVELSKNNLNFDKCILIQRVPITETQTDPDTQEETTIEVGCDYEYVEIDCPNNQITNAMTSAYVSTTLAALLPSKIITLGNTCFQNFTNLRYINLNNITTYNIACLNGCSNLNLKIKFENMISIGERAFMGTNITFDETEITCSNTIHLSAFQNNFTISDLTLNAPTVYANGNCGDGTGTLTINATSIQGQNNGNVNSTKHFKYMIFNGNVSIGHYSSVIHGGKALNSLKINGNIIFTGNVGLISYTSASPYEGVWNFNFFEITGSISNTNNNKTLFYVNNDRSLGPNMIIHLAKTDGIACDKYGVRPDFSRVIKIYVGDGSSLENDQAVLDMYLADEN